MKGIYMEGRERAQVMARADVADCHFSLLEAGTRIRDNSTREIVNILVE